MPQNNKHIVAERRHQIAALYLKGWAQFKIAEHVGVTQACVSKDLKVLSTKWKESAMVDINDIKQRELAKIDHLEHEAWEAWEKSKQDTKETTRKAKKAGEKTTYKEQTDKEVVRLGNPQFFATIQWCINKRCEIFGVDAPKQVENKIVNEFDNKSDEELEALANGKV